MGTRIVYLLCSLVLFRRAARPGAEKYKFATIQGRDYTVAVEVSGIVLATCRRVAGCEEDVQINLVDIAVFV